MSQHSAPQLRRHFGEQMTVTADLPDLPARKTSTMEGRRNTGGGGGDNTTDHVRSGEPNRPAVVEVLSKFELEVLWEPTFRRKHV